MKDYPQGWPQLAALHHKYDNFAIYRRFGLIHSRLLVQLQAEIALLEYKLSDLDQADASTGSENAWRLGTTEYEEYWDSDQRDLLKELREKVLQYGKKDSLRELPSRGKWQLI